MFLFQIILNLPPPILITACLLLHCCYGLMYTLPILITGTAAPVVVVVVVVEVITIVASFA